MKLKIAWIGKTKGPAIQALTDEYLKRLARYVPVEGVSLKDEAALKNVGGRGVRSFLVLLDSRGKQLSSEEFAKFLGNYQDQSPAPLVFVIGPANGFSEEARGSASLLIERQSSTRSPVPRSSVTVMCAWPLSVAVPGASVMSSA